MSKPLQHPPPPFPLSSPNDPYVNIGYGPLILYISFQYSTSKHLSVPYGPYLHPTFLIQYCQRGMRGGTTAPRPTKVNGWKLTHHGWNSNHWLESQPRCGWNSDHLLNQYLLIEVLYRKHYSALNISSDKVRFPRP